ncbi:unnamed protein product [Mytilus coruscus]|uniref:Uncharacterized protein n=1 Tax=Mytilus coruscus TaxID=42192 RepID=A0A6J8CES3_MYTCO|nr:unnamed protein product [Mytilus coruscus]
MHVHSDSGFPKTSVTGFPEISVTGITEMTDTEFPETSVTGFSETLVTGFFEQTVTGFPETSVTGFPETSVTEFPETSVTAFPETTVTGFPETTVTGFPETSVTGFPETSVTGFPETSVTGFPETTVTWIDAASHCYDQHTILENNITILTDYISERNNVDSLWIGSFVAWLPWIEIRGCYNISADIDTVTDISNVDDPAVCQVKCMKIWKTSIQYFGFNKHDHRCVCFEDKRLVSEVSGNASLCSNCSAARTCDQFVDVYKVFNRSVNNSTDEDNFCLARNCSSIETPTYSQSKCDSYFKAYCRNKEVAYSSTMTFSPFLQIARYGICLIRCYIQIPYVTRNSRETQMIHRRNQPISRTLSKGESTSKLNQYESENILEGRYNDTDISNGDYCSENPVSDNIVYSDGTGDEESTYVRATSGVYDKLNEVNNRRIPTKNPNQKASEIEGIKMEVFTLTSNIAIDQKCEIDTLNSAMSSDYCIAKPITDAHKLDNSLDNADYVQLDNDEKDESAKAYDQWQITQEEDTDPTYDHSKNIIPRATHSNYDHCSIQK